MNQSAIMLKMKKYEFHEFQTAYGAFVGFCLFKEEV